MKKCLLVMLIFSFICLFISCGNKDIEIKGENTVEVGCSIKLEVINGKGELNWNSSDNSIASVIDGLVIGHSEGEVTITVSSRDKTASINITITPIVLDITIIGFTNIYLGEEAQFNCELSKEVVEDIKWSSSDKEIITIDENGVAKGLKEGTATLTATVCNVSESIDVIVNEYTISLLGRSKLKINDTYQVTYKVNPEGLDIDYVFKSSKPEVATVSDTGLVTAISEGKTVITCSSKNAPKIKAYFVLDVVDYEPLYVEIDGENEVEAGKHIILNSKVTGDGSKELIWDSTNRDIAICYQGIVLGIKEGTTKITATCAEDKTVKATMEVTVKKFVNEEAKEEDLKRVNEILNKMTLAQKVGQMFIVGFSGTSINNDLINGIKQYNIGNVIYMGYNVTSPSTLTKLSNDIQNKMVECNGVPAFISTDQEGGRVARLVDGGTHFISQMAMAATGDYNNTYLEAKAMGEELFSYGINMDFAPVLDVNNNPNNPVIGHRSYGDNPVIAALYGNEAIKGFKETNVIATAKHFPGHGNTSVDSHVGLPVITSNIKDLYAIELAPFISSISNGIDAIMTTHIIFEAIDSKYPATLSEIVLQDLLRDKLGFNGLIITDGMEMDAVAKNYGSYTETAILAVKAGVDILTYTSLANPIKAHQGIIKAVEDGEITEERINESVRRILLAKLNYGILDNYITEDIDRSEMLEKNEELNLKLAMEAVTLVKGDFKGLDKNKSTLIISPTLSESLGTGLKDNSFANYAANYLKEKGHSKCDYRTVKANIGSTELSSILTVASDYDQIVVAFSNVKTSNYKNTANFVTELTKNHQNVIVVALDTPYDYLSYGSNVKNYICIYGYQKISTIALTKYLNGEFEATGVSPVSTKLFE